MSNTSSSCPFTLPPDFEVVGYEPLVNEEGGFKKGNVYVLGEKSKPPSCDDAEVVDGWQGRETRIRTQGIIPIRVIEIVEAEGENPS